MLEELVVAGLGAIEEAEITLADGLGALTGETGAGKTLLVAALGLVVGGRADKTLVREGSADASVEARFALDSSDPAAVFLADNDLATGDAELVIARVVAPDGRGRARVNGKLVTATLLAELGELLVEIAGQHNHQRLSKPAVQRTLLDAFAGPNAEKLAREVAIAVREATAARRELQQLEEDTRERERELDVLRFEVEEITAVELEPGETERLQSQAARLEHASSIAEGLGRATEALKKEGGAVDLLGAAVRELAETEKLDPSLRAARERLETVLYEAADAADGIAAEDVAVDPDALEQVRARLDAISRLRRKYGADETAILDYLQKAQERLSTLDTAQGSLDRLKEEANAKHAEAERIAAELSELRTGAAPRLAEDVVSLLGELAMAGARFEVAIDGCELYEGGAERVEFRVAANPGETPKPLTKVASGGELSRIALALHVLTGTSTASTLVFDEVDAGVGGEAAQAVGRSLARLATERAAQVLVVTHLPQVAAFADTQYRVGKVTRKGRSSVDVARVEGDERIEELSRMLAGMPESEKARQHAEELLEIAGRSR